MSSARTPFVLRLFLALVSLAYPRADREDIIGDLIEQRAEEGRSQFWAAGQAFAMMWGFRRGGEPRRRRGPAHHLDTVRQDLSHAVRALGRAPGFTTVAVVTLMLGIGLTAAVYSLVHGVLIRPLPYTDSGSILQIAEIKPAARQSFEPPGRGQASTVSDTLTGQLLSRAKHLRAVSPVSTAGARLQLADGPGYARIASVGPAFFEIFPASPTAGRLLTPEDGRTGAQPVIVVAHGFWRSSLQGQASAVGRPLVIDGTPHMVVGVLPDWFTYPDRDVQIWKMGSWRWPEPGGRRMMSLSTEVVARLASGSTLAAAEAEANALALDVAMADPGYYEGQVSASKVTLDPLKDAMGRPMRSALLMLMSGVGCVLLLACVNLTNLLLARGTARQRELAVREALGGSKLRVIRPALFENVLLTIAGAGAGLLLAWSLLRLTPALVPEDVPRLAEVTLQPIAVALAAGVSAVIAGIFGMVPILQLPRARLRDALGPGRAALAGRSAGSADRIRSVLVVVQIAVSVVLLIAAGLLMRSLARVLSVDTGYKADSTLTFQIRTASDFWRDGARQLTFYDEVLQRLASHPEVEAVGYSTQLPLLGGRNWGSVSVVGDPPPADRNWPRAHYEIVTPGYFAAVGLPLVAGRGFTEGDHQQAEKVAIVSEEFVRQHLKGRDPLSVHLQYGRMPHLRIVGVVKTKRNAGPTSDVQPEMFAPLPQVPPVFREGFVGGGFAVRTGGDPFDLVPFIREQVRAADALSPIYNVMTLEDRIWRATAQPRFYAAALGIFSAFALVTAMLGTYGVLAYAVERRRLEFGIRRALGAQTAQIMRLVLRRGLTLTAIGLPVGLALAAAGVGFLRSLLFQVEPGDPMTFAGVAVSVVGVAALACVIPARRATRVQPTEALKLE